MSDLERIWFKSSKYKEKKTIKNKDGEETTVYEYSDRQVNKRHKDKSEKVEKIRKNISDLEKKIYSDLKGKENNLVALAVALINHTYERVGNDESASNGHYGVTGWKKKHLSFKGDRATLKYTGKSGVRHEKEISDKKLVSALKEISKGLSKEDCLLEGISASDVNDYLDQFGITAKDIRGYHANREMQERLKALREENGELPKDKKEKEQQLKEEFKEALDGAAKAVGHEEATLRKQYLVPHLEETYMKDGTVITTLKKATLVRIASQVFATKSQSEKEEEEIERLQKPSPKKKPPRKDRSRKRMKVEDKDIDKDPDMNTKDMSMNYKIVGSQLERVWFRGAKEELVTVRRKDDGKVVQVSKKTLEERKSEFDLVENEDKDADSDKGEKKEPTKEDVKKKLKGEPLLTQDDLKELEELLDIIEEETKEEDQKEFDAEYDRILTERKEEKQQAEEQVKKEQEEQAKKEREEKEISTKDKAQQTLSNLVDNENALKEFENILKDISDSELGYFNEALQDQKKELEELAKKIESSEDEKEIEELKKEFQDKEALSSNLSQVQDIISVNAILRGLDTELDDSITDQQKTLVKFLGGHTDTGSLSIQKAMSKLVQTPEGSTDDQKEINSKYQTRQAIKELTKNKSLDEKMDILLSKDLGEDSNLKESFLAYKKKLDNPALSNSQRKKLEDLANSMFSTAMAEALTLESGKDSSEGKDKNKETPKSKKEQQEIRKNFLDGVGKIMENLATFLVENPNTELSSLTDTVTEDISNQAILQQLQVRIDNEQNPEIRRTLQEQMKNQQEQIQRTARIKRNLVIAWGNI